jgi:hypothetical protein
MPRNLEKAYPVPVVWSMARAPASRTYRHLTDAA